MAPALAAPRSRAAAPPPPQELGGFDTVQTLWSYLNNLYNPSQLQVGAELSFFQRPIRPSWEDPANCRGGRWTFIYPSAQFQVADECWLMLVLSLAGETLDPGFGVCGVSAAMRSNKIGHYLRLSIWTLDREDSAANLAVGNFAQRLSGGAKFEYQDHGAGYSDYRHVLEPPDGRV